MPATNPRVNVVLDEPLYQGLRRWAKRDGISLSLKVRDLVKDALDIEEDRVLANIADGRMATFDRKAAKTHAEVWGTSKRPRR
ncbi:MAG: antitoxin, RHH family protein [Nitrospira sp.]|nr:MAG: antitoxin, RHH family protein [Nitrospira sp.]